jgi:hypothetical protein
MEDEPRKITFWSVFVALAFLGGIVAGPGCWIYCAGFSGKLVDSHRVREVHGGLQAIEVALDPSMNPLRLELSATIRRSILQTRSVGYRVQLADRREVLLEKSTVFDLNSKDPDMVTKSNVVGTATVPVQGSYYVKVSGGSRDGSSLAIRDLQLSIWRNARVPNMKIVWWGIGIMVASLVFGGMTGQVVSANRDV